MKTFIRRLRRFSQRIGCCLGFHDLFTTGRRGWVLFEVKCKRCGGLYIGHYDHPGILIKGDHCSDRMLSRLSPESASIREICESTHE